MMLRLMCEECPISMRKFSFRLRSRIPISYPVFLKFNNISTSSGAHIYM